MLFLLLSCAFEVFESLAWWLGEIIFRHLFCMFWSADISIFNPWLCSCCLINCGCRAVLGGYGYSDSWLDALWRLVWQVKCLDQGSSKQRHWVYLPSFISISWPLSLDSYVLNSSYTLQCVWLAGILCSELKLYCTARHLISRNVVCHFQPQRSHVQTSASASFNQVLRTHRAKSVIDHSDFWILEFHHQNVADHGNHDQYVAELWRTCTRKG